MPERPPNLEKPYSAYYYRDVPQENTELTHVGPGTPCGEYFRRFWHPVGFSSELTDLPRRIKILGEDLVLFRDLSGRAGLLQLHCSHRGASLEFGRIAKQGIICCYHGWHFDIDGRIIDTPGEPPEAIIKDRVHHGAYPTHEYGGLVFAYMGPPEKKPPFPIFDTFVLPNYRLAPTIKNILPCNWLQMKENSMDPVHTVYLHTVVTGIQFTEAFGEVGNLDWMKSPAGMVYMHTRRVEENVWVHMSDYLPPNIHQFCATWEDGKLEKKFQRPMITLWNVPIDNTSTMNLGFRHINEAITQEEQDRINAQKNSLTGEGFGQNGNRPYEERQRIPGDYDAQVGQRPIAVHALEHLGTTDRGVVMLRRIVREGVRAVQRGEDPEFLHREEGRIIPTYSNDTIIRLPKPATDEAEKLLLRETGRKVAEEIMALGLEREKTLERV
jgi:phenylpropionate dioxygenase-like ring-hydroxylating dioxygenase large terminal subunit